MNLVQCPDEYLPGFTAGKPPVVFLAGGITSCPLWQDVAIDLFKDTNVTILNPRRKIWNEKITPYEQIKWEYDHIKRASTVMFWFPHETLCPITLLELGKLLMTSKELVVGIHPDYARKADVEIQTALERTDYYRKVPIFYSLEDTVNHVKSIL